jgi:hypothetical protein
MAERILSFHGEVFTHDLEDSSLKFHIREPFFSAGKRFGWSGSSCGLGLNQQALDYAKKWNLKIIVTVHGKRYVTHWKTWLSNGRTWKLENGVSVLVLQWCSNFFVTLD